MNPREYEFSDRVQAWLGTAMMLMASFFAVLIFCDRMEMEMFSLPVVWYSTRHLHLIFCGSMFISAAVLLKSPPLRSRRDGRPLFGSCRLLTRKECHLCEDALATLLRFQDALPSIEIVEIDNDPRLVRQFGESVPVVEIDGRVRFRGAVQPVLLRRLIDAAERREGHPSVEYDGQEARTSGIPADRGF
jgi:hypothetical protein